MPIGVLQGQVAGFRVFVDRELIEHQISSQHRYRGSSCLGAAEVRPLVSIAPIYAHPACIYGERLTIWAGDGFSAVCTDAVAQAPSQPCQAY